MLSVDIEEKEGTYYIDTVEEEVKVWKLTVVISTFSSFIGLIYTSHAASCFSSLFYKEF